MESTRKLFISNLKKIRNAKGLTQAQLAELIEISLSGYAQIEYGTNWPTPKTLGMLTEKLEVPTSEFFRDENSPSEDVTQKADSIVRIVGSLPALNNHELGAVLSIVDAALAAAARTNSADSAG